MNTLVELITFPRVLCIILGLVLGEVIRFFVNRHRVKKGKQPKASTFNAVVGAIVIIAAVWVMVAVAQGRNCALTVNLSVAEAQRIDAIDNDSFQLAIRESLQLPPEIQALPNGDPRKEAVTGPIRDRYLASQAEVTKLRDANKANQAAAQKACGVK